MKFSEMPYRRPDTEDIRRKYEQITEEFGKAGSADEQYRLILEHEKLSGNFETMGSIAYIRNSINTIDPYYEAEMAFFDANTPVVNTYRQNFYKAVDASSFRQELEQRAGKLFFTNLELSLKTFSPETVELQKKENALVTEYEKLLASAKIDFGGETLNLSEMQKHTISPDRSNTKRSVDEDRRIFCRKLQTP